MKSYERERTVYKHSLVPLSAYSLDPKDGIRPFSVHIMYVNYHALHSSSSIDNFHDISLYAKCEGILNSQACQLYDEKRNP